MPTSSRNSDRLNASQSDVRRQIATKGRLHWIHWIVLSFSLALTFGAWWFTSRQVQEKLQMEFDQEAEHVVELVTERMAKYEDVLWGGVAFLGVHGSKLTAREWHQYSTSLSIDLKHPGINGIGIIDSVEPKDLEAYLNWARAERPDFKPYPEHQESVYMPIRYIEPVEINRKAIGLDMAHERNRFTAAKEARDSGLAQITGPIVLVQDSEKTPRFFVLCSIL